MLSAKSSQQLYAIIYQLIILLFCKIGGRGRGERGGGGRRGGGGGGRKG